MSSGMLFIPEEHMIPGLLRMPQGLGENPSGAELPIGPFLRLLFKRLDEEGVRWAVLRNAEGLPEFTRYDVDLLVEPGCHALFRLVDECAAETDWRCTGRIRKRHYTCLLMAKSLPSGGLFFLPLDFFTGLEYRGLRFLKTEDVLAERIRSDTGVWGLPPETDAAITLLKEWLPHGTLKENSRDSVFRNAAADPESFRWVLVRAVGEAFATELAEKVRREEWTLSFGEARALRREIRRRTPRPRMALLHAAVMAAVHVFRPSPGLVVCLAGADGSGKTTLARGVAAAAYRHPFKAIRYIHGNAGVLPRFRDMRAWFRPAAPPPSDVPEPVQHLKGMMEPVAAWKSVVLALYYALDLNLARWRLRRWRGQWSLVLMDRSFYDYCFQLGHRNCPAGFLRLLSRLVPRPDLLLCLVGDAEKIHARKPELTVEEIEREQEVLRGLAERQPFARLLDGRGGIQSMVEQGLQEVRKRLPSGALRFACVRMGGRPVLAWPAGSVREQLRAVELFPGTTPKRRWLACGIRVAICCRLGRLLCARCESPDPLLPVPDLYRLLSDVRVATGRRITDWLISWPARPERKRIYLILRFEGVSELMVLKIGAGGFNGRQLRNEAAALKRLAGASRLFDVPSFLFERELPGGRFVLAAGGFPAFLHAARQPPVPETGKQLIEKLRQQPVPQKVLRLADCTWMLSFKENAPDCPARTRLLSREGDPLEVVFAHGDLGPGNLMMGANGKPLLFDWENASDQAPVPTDAVGFWIACRQQQILENPRELCVALRQDQRENETALLAALGFLCAHDNLAATRLLEEWK